MDATRHYHTKGLTFAPYDTGETWLSGDANPGQFGSKAHVHNFYTHSHSSEFKRRKVIGKPLR